MPSDLHDAEEEEAHGELGEAVAGYGEGVCDVGPEDGVGGLGDAEFPEVLPEAVVYGYLDEDCEA